MKWEWCLEGESMVVYFSAKGESNEIIIITKGCFVEWQLITFNKTSKQESPPA